MVRVALCMIAQDLDHTAIGNHAPRALNQHPLQLGLERHEPRNARFDRCKLRRGDGICRRTGLVWPVRKAEQVSDCIEREPKFAGMADEGQPILCLLAIKPLIACAAFGLGQKADLFIVADGRHFDPGGIAQFSDVSMFCPCTSSY